MIHMISEKSRKDIREIMKEIKPWADIFEEYDRTGVWPLKKVRKDFTLEARSVRKLERMAREKGISQSELLDRIVQENEGSKRAFRLGEDLSWYSSSQCHISCRQSS